MASLVLVYADRIQTVETGTGSSVICVTACPDGSGMSCLSVDGVQISDSYPSERLAPGMPLDDALRMLRESEGLRTIVVNGVNVSDVGNHAPTSNATDVIFWGVEHGVLHLGATWSPTRRSGFRPADVTDRNHDEAIPWSSRRSDITEVVVDERIAPASMAYWFYYCSNLWRCDLALLDTRNVTNMHATFCCCWDREFNPDVSNWDTSSVTDMSYLFADCFGEDFNPDLSGWDTSNVTTMNQMFAFCYGESFNPDVANWNVSKVEDMLCMFQSCHGDSFNPNLYEWDGSSVKKWDWMFDGCKGRAFTSDQSNRADLWAEELSLKSS